MNESQFLRSEMVLGNESTNILKNSKVIVFGLGGVGSYVAEALARAGVGNITIVDSDTVSESNINRQLCALHSSVGKNKTDVVCERMLDIFPECNVLKINKFYLSENADEFNLTFYDYIADCIDTVSSKIDLAVRAQENNIPIISCMGTGNKLDPTRFLISDIYKTSVCPLCRVMRYELKKRGVKKLNVLWSDEPPVKSTAKYGDKNAPGSVSFVPGVAGLIIAGEIIKDLCKG